MRNRIRELRKEKGWTMAQLAERCRPPTDASTVNKLEKNQTRLTTQWMERFALAFDVSPVELLQAKEGRSQVSVVGYVGAGHEIYPVDDHMIGAGLDEIEVPAGLGDTVALIVRGDSMWPRYDEGDRILYRRYEGSPDDLMNRECVVKLRDGRLFLKLLRKGSEFGLYDLFSHNAPPLESQAVEWAAPVLHVERKVGAQG